MSDLIGPGDAAAILGVSEQYITKLLRQGKLPGQKVGQRWVISRQDVEEFKRLNPTTGQGHQPD